MRMISRAAITTALLLPLGFGPLAAQNYRWDIGVNGGYSWLSDLLDEEDAGLPEDFEDDVKLESGALLGAQLGFWASPNIGLRLNGAYADRSLASDEINLIENVNLWSGSLDLLWRFNRPNTDWMGTEVLPYLALGLGAKWINPGGDAFDCVEDEDGDFEVCGPFNVATVGAFGMPEQTRFMGLVGLGTDIRVSPSFAFRLEANDRIFKPEVYALDATDFTVGVESVGKTVHELGLQLGLHLLMGLDRAEVVSVAPAPAPLPPPPPPPPPPPAPVEEAVTVCVVDPTAANGLRMQSAYYRPATRDTVVTVNGERVPLNNAVGSVMVVRNADWYVRGQPLTLRIGDERIEYLTYQGARRIEASDLAYLGTINGYPVYADRDEVADVVNALADVRRANAGRDLGDILDEREDLRNQINDVEYLYVPVESTGCVFQALRAMEPVQKGK